MAEERRVWIVQALCGPERHCIVAVTGEAESQADVDHLTGELRAQLADMLLKKLINPWCGLCGATTQKWRYEAGRTPYRTMAEAQPHLEEEERRQALTRDILTVSMRGKL